MVIAGQDTDENTLAQQLELFDRLRTLTDTQSFGRTCRAAEVRRGDVEGGYFEDSRRGSNHAYAFVLRQKHPGTLLSLGKITHEHTHNVASVPF